jgi:hypothetical protein
MKEAKWLAETDDPYRMLNYLGKRVSSRKARLLACACFRRQKPKLKKWEQQIVEIAERYADGLASPEGLQNAQDESVGKSGVAWVTMNMDYWTAVEAARAAGEWRDEPAQCSLVRDLFGNPYHPLPPRKGKRLWHDTMAVLEFPTKSGHGVKLYSVCSYSAGDTYPSEECRRLVL